MSLPESWREVPIAKVADVFGGGTPDRATLSYFGGEYYWATPTDVTRLSGYYINSTQETLTGLGLKNSSAKLLPVGTVLLTSRATIGNTAVANTPLATNQGFVNLVPDLNLINSEFLARQLEALKLFLESRAGGSTFKEISRSAIAKISINLPTLPEQERIVDVLRLADALAKAKQSVNDQIEDLVRTAYWEHFGNWYTAAGLRDSVRISQFVADSQYGVSEAMEETGPHVVLRMNSITTNGWLNLSDLKYANLSKKDIESTELKNGDLLFNRTNSKELVGKCAIWREAKRPYSFASYLVRLRLKKGMLPEYLWATLNSAYGKYRLINSAKQAVSMANVSPTDLGRITVPLPPLELQENFASLVKSVELLRNEMLSKLDAFSELQRLLTQQALVGELTANWRERNQEEIIAAAINRDALLRGRGAKLKEPAAEPKLSQTQNDDVDRPARHWLIGELSEFQRQALAAFKDYYEKNDQQPVLAEDPDEFARFCDDDEVTERLQAFGSAVNNRIRRTLSQLAALGLLAKVTLPKQNLDTGEREYLKAFRPLRETEFTRLADVEALRKMLSADNASYRFTLRVDYETSEHAGAGGMFQVTDLRDDNDKVRTDLVDQGKHYSEFEELTADIAHRLGVRADQVELEEL